VKGAVWKKAVQKKYSERFKERMVARMLGERRMSASALSKEVGIGQPTLSRWLREAARFGVVMDSDEDKRAERRPEDWSPQEKLQAVHEAAEISEAELGVWLRRRGLKQEHLRQWRELALSGFSQRPTRASSEDRKRIEKLEKELKRKDKALAETAALLVLQGKMQALWAEEDDTTGQTSGEPSSKGSRGQRRRGPG
jgi:transposase-like protein